VAGNQGAEPLDDVAHGEQPPVRRHYLKELGSKPADTASFRAAADAMNIPLSVVAVAGDEARELYGADLALIRPDQIVAWRGNSTSEAANVLSRAAGHI